MKHHEGIVDIKSLKERKRVVKVHGHSVLKPNQRVAVKYTVASDEGVLQTFKRDFREDLLGWMDHDASPAFKVVTAGGYGLKTLVETKYGIMGRVKTGDVDLTVSVKGCRMTPVKAFEYWAKRVNAWIARQNRGAEDFQVKVVNFGGEDVPILNYKRFYVIMISYRGEDFVDVAITDMAIERYMVDKKTSKAGGLPVKREEYYLKEFLSLIYMENVPGVNEYCYYKRHPVTGEMSSKGVKDIDRSKLLCRLKRMGRYRRYCALLKEVTLAKLERMTKEARDKYFRSLKNITTNKP